MISITINDESISCVEWCKKKICSPKFGSKKDLSSGDARLSNSFSNMFLVTYEKVG